MSQSRSVIAMIGTDCPPEREAEFNKWYNERLVPQVRNFPGLTEVTRFKLDKVLRGNGDYPRYLAIYKFKDKKTSEAWFASPQVNAAIAEFHGMINRGEAVLKYQLVYDTLKTWQEKSGD